ncbi:MAG: heavy-metal-associated domain-containing protein [Methylococcales bacterium]|jgi:copper chaperone CopZ|nr:heavy-metal-associated domain-containing protein [Methylococcales bacterium]MBT7408189.1 heavy-metal-associated domain-containing protein [Methylococcales bacterium]
MEIKIAVNNVKCGGCVSAIKDKLSSHQSIQQIEVDIPTGMVTIDSQKDVTEEVKQILVDSGYPPK